MAFDLQFLQRISATVDLNKISNPLEGQVTGQGPTGWLYNASATGANNSTAETQAANYFDGALGYLSVLDFIYVISNDPGVHFLTVATNNGTHVTTVVIV